MNSMEVREYVVCYFDLLGQREGLLKRVRTEAPSEDLQKEIDSVSSLIVFSMSHCVNLLMPSRIMGETSCG